MKILHTADWHIGKVLHKHPLSDEMALFLDWLESVIRSQSIDVLLVSGDIFDVANPAVKDRSTYYGFLSRLIGTGTKVIITGGNHDSVALLDAPQEILRHLDVTVIGGAQDDLGNELIEIKDITEETKLVIAAVPFLRDKDLRNLSSDTAFDNRADALREGIRRHYHALGDICNQEYKGVPRIAMGHLYARGASTSESERDIHIGNAAAVDSTVFSDAFDYIALGHIHRPQIVGGSEMCRYSGSPIALSFSEKNDVKTVLLVELSDGNLASPTVIEVPKARDLYKVSGTIQEVKSALEKYKPDFELVSFVEVEVTEEQFSTSILSEVDQLVAEYSDHPKIKILKSRTQFLHGAKDTADLFEQGANIEDLSPKEVFDRRLDAESIPDNKKTELRSTFMELLDEVLNNG